MAIRAEIVTKKSSIYPAVCQLVKTAFPKNEQCSMWFLHLGALRKNVSFRAFFDENQFCGISYTVERGDYLFILYLAVNDTIRFRGYGSRILQWIRCRTDKNIVLNVEAIDPSAKNAEQRKKRVDFYRRNGIVESGFYFLEEGVRYSILTSNPEKFDLQKYNDLLKWSSFGTWRNTILKE